MRSTLGDATACNSHGVPDFLMIVITIKVSFIMYFMKFTPTILKNLFHIFNVSFSSTYEIPVWVGWILMLGLAVLFLDLFYSVFFESNETSSGKYQLFYVYHSHNINYYFPNIIYIYIYTGFFDIFRHLSLNF